MHRIKKKAGLAYPAFLRCSDTTVSAEMNAVYLSGGSRGACAEVFGYVVNVFISAAGEIDKNGAVGMLLGIPNGVGHGMGTLNGWNDTFVAR